MVICYVGCAQQNSGPPPNAVSTADQIARVKTDFDPSRVLKLRGVLRDHNGKRVTGFVGVLFAVYEQQQGGAPLWQEVQNVQVENGGYFTALVGSTTNGGIRSELFGTEKALWLGEQVLLPGEVEQPRIRLVSTSYGLMRAASPVIPVNSGDQPATAEAQQAPGVTPGSQQDQSAPSNKLRRARRRLHGPVTP